MLVSVAAYCLAFPPWNVSLAAWVALVPLLLALHGCGPLSAAAIGFVWGVGVLWGIGYWVAGGLALYWQQPYWFALLFALAIAVVYMGQYFAVFSAAYGRIRARWSPTAIPWVVAALYVTCEFARERLLTGHPWLLLGYALVPHVAFVQVADFGGVYVLSFVLVLTSASLVEAIVHRDRRTSVRIRPILGALGAILAVWTYGMLRLSVPLPREPEVPVMVVQGNVDVGSQWRRDLYGEGLGQYLRLSDDAAAHTHPGLIVWPESAVTFFLEEEPTYLRTIARVLRSHDADLVLGGPWRDGHEERYFNSAFYVTADGGIAGRYDKVHLLPFAEYFPLRTIHFLRRQFGRIRYFTPSEEPALLHTRFGDAATLICFEAIFPEVVRRQTTAGATFMLNLSNDAWFGGGAGADQHLMMVALRAVENRLWVVRGTTTGVSAIIDPYGRITERVPLFTPGTIDGRIVPMNVGTPYKLWGDAFAWLCVGVAVYGLLRPRPARG